MGGWAYRVWEGNIEVDAYRGLPRAIQLNATVQTGEGVRGVRQQHGFLGVRHVQLVGRYGCHCALFCGFRLVLFLLLALTLL